MFCYLYFVNLILFHIFIPVFNVLHFSTGFPCTYSRCFAESHDSFLLINSISISNIWCGTVASDLMKAGSLTEGFGDGFKGVVTDGFLFGISPSFSRINCFLVVIVYFLIFPFPSYTHYTYQAPNPASPRLKYASLLFQNLPRSLYAPHLSVPVGFYVLRILQ